MVHQKLVNVGGLEQWQKQLSDQRVPGRQDDGSEEYLLDHQGGYDE